MSHLFCLPRSSASRRRRRCHRHGLRRVPLACSIVEPDGTPPSGGWPAVILFHGLGGSHTDMEPLATQALAPAGFASLECDARGTGASGGVWGLDGPRDVQDARDLFTWLTARPEISDTQIGAFGISLGGGAVWNATAAGVPFKAIVPVITWTNLQTALAPNNLAKSGLVQLLAPRADARAGIPRCSPRSRRSLQSRTSPRSRRSPQRVPRRRSSRRSRRRRCSSRAATTSSSTSTRRWPRTGSSPARSAVHRRPRPSPRAEPARGAADDLRPRRGLVRSAISTGPTARRGAR